MQHNASELGDSFEEYRRAELRDMMTMKVSEVRPFRSLAARQKQQRAPNNQRALLSEAEMVPEILFIGEILNGEGFQGVQFGISCSWHFIWDDPWILLEVIS